MRSKFTTDTKLRKVVIGLSIIVAIIFVGWLAWFVASTFAFVDQTNQALLPAAVVPVASSIIKEPPVVEAPVPEEVPQVTTEPVAVAPAPTASEAPQVATPLQAPPSRWTPVFDTVGIPEADRPIILELAMSGFDWRLAGCACGQAARALTSPESRFTYLNLYVMNKYGSWSAARDQAVQGNW